MQGYPEMFFDLVFGFLALFAITKVLGKTQISQITAFDFISAIVLGELIGNALYDDKIGIPQIAFVVVVWGSLMWITEYVTQRFKRSRYLLEGSPSLIIHSGNLIRDEMKKNKLDINQLKHLLRAKDVFSLDEVEYAILETNGTLSVMKKSEFQNPTRKDMKLAPEPARMPITLINDGEIIYDNLKEKNLTEEWLHDQLKEQNYQLEDIFHAEYEKGKDLQIYPVINRNHQKWDV
jgi:uncharacterized membrane protein YcaP (DUF421 family)